MAQEKIEIKFIATGNVPLVKAIKELDKATRRLNKEFKTLNTTQQKAADSTEKLSHRVGRNTEKVNANSTAFTRLQSIISVYRNKMLLASFATGLILRPLMRMTEEFGKFEDLSRGFNNLGRSINATPKFLEKLEKATNGTVDAMDLMQQANNAMMLGIVKSEDEMSQLFDTAQRLGQSLGRDTVSSIESLVTGMGRQSRQQLDNIGIMVKADVAYANFAKTNNKLAKDLTQAEKKIAFNTEAMRQANEIVNKLGVEVLSTSQYIQMIQVSTSKLSRSLGEILSPIIIGLALLLRTLADVISDNVKILKALVAGTVAVTLAYVTQIGVLKLLNSQIVFNIGFMLLQKGALAALKIALLGAAAGMKAFLVASLAVAPYVAIFAAVTAAVYYFVDSQKEANESIEQFNNRTVEATNAVDDYKASVQQNINTLQEELDLLNAENDIQRMAIKLKRDLTKANNGLHQSEIDLLNAIQARKEELKALEDVEKEELKRQQEIQKIIKESAMFGKDRTLESLKEKESLIAAEIDHAEAIMHRSMMEGVSTEESAKMEGILDSLKNSHISIKNEIDKHIERNRELTDAEKQSAEAIKASESAYDSTTEAQVELLKSQIAIIEALDATDPANQKAIAGLDALKNKLNELVAESSSIDILGENLTQTLETISGFLEEQVALTQASAEAKMAIHDQEANAEIDALKKTRSFQKMSASRQEEELAKIRKDAENKKNAERKKANKQMAIQFRLNQILAISDAVSNTSVAYTKALAQGGFVLGIKMASVVAALGAVQVASIASQQPPKMEQGGLIGGRRHSQGGTLIEAEQGEFVMNRNAVDAIGVENLNRMNTGGGGASITFSGNVMSDDFIETEAIPKIREAIRRGSDIGVS